MCGGRGRPSVLMVLLAVLLMWWSSMCPPYMVLARGRHRSRLALWIDKQQVKRLTGGGFQYDISIIADGMVTPYLKAPELHDILIIPKHIDTVNLTWQAGPDRYSYVFDNFTSLDQHLLYQPLLGIPARGYIPRFPTIFQITIPCKGKQKGRASLLLGLKIYDPWGQPVKGTPIQFRLRKDCDVFVTSALCKQGCKNGGTCNSHGVCECPQGFKGKLCDIALCSPPCRNNGTCISPSHCDCPPGYSGSYCEKANCFPECQHGGICLAQGFCWCATGFYGDACEYSHCNPRCQNGGTCMGPGHCQCPADYSGDYCEHQDDSERNRRSKEPDTGAKTVGTVPKKSSGKTKFSKLENKIRKAEQRLLRITYRRSRKWNISKAVRRTLRTLKHKAAKESLSRKERRYIIKLLTRERKHLNSKDKTKVKRFRNLIRQMKRKQKKPKRRRKFVK